MCSALSYFVFPAHLTAIGNGAFHSCSALKCIVLPADLTFIGDNAFRFCVALTRVTLPTTCTAIGVNAFPPTTNLVRLPPALMRALRLWYDLVDAALAYKRCRWRLYGWLERAQLRLDSYGVGGAARKRDLDEFESDFAPGHA